MPALHRKAHVRSAGVGEARSQFYHIQNLLCESLRSIVRRIAVHSSGNMVHAARALHNQNAASLCMANSYHHIYFDPFPTFPVLGFSAAPLASPFAAASRPYVLIRSSKLSSRSSTISASSPSRACNEFVSYNTSIQLLMLGHTPSP